MKGLIKAFPFNLAFAITREEESALQVNQYNLIKILDTLTEREKAIIISRFKDKKTLQVIGESNGVSRERIRQIEAKALRKLRHPTRTRHLKTITINEHNKALETIMSLEAENHRITNKYNKLVDDIKTGKVINKLSNEEVTNIYNMTIEELGLSVRAYNCLWRAGIRDLGNLLKLKVEELTKIRNLGAKTANEIIYTVESRGYKFKE